LQEISYLFAIAAAITTMVAAFFTAIVQIRKLPKDWYIVPLDWVIICAPLILSILAVAALYVGIVRVVAGLLLASLVASSISFARQPQPLTRSSVAWFVLFSAINASVIPAILLGDLLGRVIEVQSQSIDLVQKLVGAPPTK
jgi:hypothetical protein